MMQFHSRDTTPGVGAVAISVLVLVMMSLVPTVAGDDDTTCTMVANNPCVCRMNNGSAYIDLTTAAQGEDDGPWITALDSTGVRQFTYYYDPCRNFTKHECKDTLVCQYDMASDKYYDLGQEKTTKIVYEDSVKGIVMEYISKDNERETNVTVICSSSFSFTATEDRLHPKHYIFKLTHPCACVGKCGTFNHPITFGGVPLWGIILAGVGGGLLVIIVVVYGSIRIVKKTRAMRYQQMTEADPHVQILPPSV